MPIYEYECPRCKTRVEQIRKYEERDARQACRVCFDSALRGTSGPHYLEEITLRRVDAAPASIFPGAASWR